MLGRAVPDAPIQVYLDDRLAGRGGADAAGAWSVTLDKSVPPGHYGLRVEALDKDGQALGRLALKFDRVRRPQAMPRSTCSPATACGASPSGRSATASAIPRSIGRTRPRSAIPT